MRVAFTGKGGSGKTTLCSLFAKQAAVDGHRVLALDADINQHLAEALGVSMDLPSMGENIAHIKAHLVGDNPLLSAETMQKTTPPGHGSSLVTLADDDWFMRHYAVGADGTWVAGAGEIPEGNVGIKCYHGLNGAIELVLGHMIDTSDDVVVVDMTAGADAFSSSLFTKVDTLVLVVEPTLKSLSVYDQFKPHAEQYGIPLFVVANKVEDEDEDDLAFIKEKVGDVVAVFPPSRYVKARERGQAMEFSELEPAIVEQLRELRGKLQATPRDWDQLQERSHLMHRRAASGWAGEEILGQIDPAFSLRQAVEQHS